MSTASYGALRKGMVIVGGDDEHYLVVDRELSPPGSCLRLTVRLTLKNLRTNRVVKLSRPTENWVERLDVRP
jgi:translation elongation factor P/translation initiation factor 5A